MKLLAPIVVASVIVTISYAGATTVGNAPVIIIGGSAIIAYLIWLLTTYRQPADASKVLPLYLVAVAAQLGSPTDRLGRVEVQSDLSIAGHSEVFVIGDLMVLQRNGQPFSPGLAPVAIQQGAYVGKRIAGRVAGGRDNGPFVYFNKGNLATIGRSFAIADLGWLRFSGLLAWLLWGGVHLVYLTKMWNRVQVFATWIWSYLTYDRAVRVLTPDSFQSDIQVAPSTQMLPVGADDTTLRGNGIPTTDQQPDVLTGERGP